MIVADTNLIAYLLLEGDQTRAAQAVLRKDPAWAAPLLWRSEFRNVLALYVRRGQLAVADAVQYAEVAEALLATREYQVQSGPVLELAKQSGCTAYDCEYIFLARELGVPLITSDQGLLRAFPSVARRIADFAT